MRVLAVETSTLAGGAALLDGERVVGQYLLDVRVTHSERLLVAVDRLLEDAGWRPAHLEGLAASGGPGSFTGLRIGLGTVKGLALALAIPVAAVPTLDAMAAALPWATLPVCPVLDARKGEVYAALYRWDGAGMRREGDYLALAPDALAARLPEPTLVLRGGAGIAGGGGPPPPRPGRPGGPPDRADGGARGGRRPRPLAARAPRAAPLPVAVARLGRLARPRAPARGPDRGAGRPRPDLPAPLGGGAQTAWPRCPLTGCAPRTSTWSSRSSAPRSRCPGRGARSSTRCSRTGWPAAWSRARTGASSATSASGRSPTRCTSPTSPSIPTPGAAASPAGCSRAPWRTSAAGGCGSWCSRGARATPRRSGSTPPSASGSSDAAGGTITTRARTRS